MLPCHRGSSNGSMAASGRVLILDEVDALVIDEEPNEPQLGSTWGPPVAVATKGSPLGVDVGLAQLCQPLCGDPKASMGPTDCKMQPSWLCKCSIISISSQFFFFYLDSLPFVACVLGSKCAQTRPDSNENGQQKRTVPTFLCQRCVLRFVYPNKQPGPQPGWEGKHHLA